MFHLSMRIVREEHEALGTVLRAFASLVKRGPRHGQRNFFDELRAMLFYIHEFPERLHHSKESNLLFPRVLRMAPEIMEVVVRLEDEHESCSDRVLKLQHLLLAWEFVGDVRRHSFEVEAYGFVSFYLEHMRLEETVVLPAAMRVLNEADWEELDAAFAKNCDPLTGRDKRDPVFNKLFKRIMGALADAERVPELVA